MTFALGSLYHGTKFAVEGISESLHYEMKEIGVKVKIVEPGFIATDFGGRVGMVVESNIDPWRRQDRSIGSVNL